MEKGVLNTKFDLVVIGGSAGGLDALLHILPMLQGTCAPLIIVLHRKYSNDSTLSDLFTARTRLKVKEVEDKDALKKGHVYIAPADYHLLIEKEKTFTLDDSEKVNYSRPSIDVTFQSAADVFGKKLACILLSGANADGTEGFEYVRSLGGTTVAQDPTSAEVPFMPRHAINSGFASAILSLDEIAGFINGNCL